ncbi:MAG: hypothetical protein ACP5UM_11010 [Anaerolineae bacterium]
MRRPLPAETRRWLWHALVVGGLLLFASYLPPWYRLAEPPGVLAGWQFLGAVMWSEHPNFLLQPLFDVAVFWPLVVGAMAFAFRTWGFPPRGWMRGMAALGFPLLGAMRWWFTGLEAVPQWGLGVAALGYGVVLAGTWGLGRTRPLA